MSEDGIYLASFHLEHQMHVSDCGELYVNGVYSKIDCVGPPDHTVYDSWNHSEHFTRKLTAHKVLAKLQDEESFITVA